MVASWSLLLFLLLSFFGSFFSPCVYVCHALTYTHDCTCTKGVNMRNRLHYCAVWMLGESKRRKYYWRELLWQADCAITALALMAWLSNELPFAVMSSVFSALANFLIKFQLCEMSPPNHRRHHHHHQHHNSPFLQPQLHSVDDKLVCFCEVCLKGSTENTRRLFAVSRKFKLNFLLN